MNAHNASALCAQAVEIVSSTELYVMYILECIIGLTAVPLNLLALYVLYHVRVFHLNLRLLLTNLNLNLIIFSFCIAEKAFERLVTPPCDLPTEFKPCLLREGLVSAPLHNALLSLVVLCLERLYATIRYRTYDSARPYFSGTLLVVAWVSTIYVQVNSYRATPADLRVPVCEAPLFLGPSQVIPVFSSFVTLESVATCISIFVYVYNRYLLERMVINRAKFDLSSRFLVDQNVKLNKALLPSDMAHMICYLPNYLMLVLTMCDVSIALRTRMWLLHLTYVYRVIYAVLHPIMLITINTSLRQGLKKSRFGRFAMARQRVWAAMCGCAGLGESKIIDVNGRATTQMHAHFDHLEKAWNQLEPPQVNRNRK